MACRIEDYALIGDCQSSALVGKNGSIDWLCLPRFDSDACFAALLGDEENGFWKIAPTSAVASVRRRYRDGTLTLETEFTTDTGTVVIIDFMPISDPTPDLVRIVTCTKGCVNVESELAIRTGYGIDVPWVQHIEGGIRAIQGPDCFRLVAPVPMRGKNYRTYSTFTVREGERVPFVLGWWPSNTEQPPPIDAEEALMDNDAYWLRWSSRCRIAGPYAEPIQRSLLTLKALTYAPTGGIVAAATTSLPESLGGVRNWDYRYCWVRDATFTLYALVSAGYTDEALAFRNWMLRAAAGMPEQLQILYGIAGERRLVEVELRWLRGYENSQPVRIGNAASTQLQLDVYGELMDTWHLSLLSGLVHNADSWGLLRALVRHLEDVWRQPDFGIWEVRGEPRHFTHSKVMCWVAFDRAVQAIEQFGLDGPVDRWRAIRDEIHAWVCREAWDDQLGSFTQFPGSKEPDASLLLMLQVGFLPPTDPRMIGTVDAVERLLTHDGLVHRYVTKASVDGLPRGEGSFLACSFWLADALVLVGRVDDARALFERLVQLCNDVGLLSEEYDPIGKRMLGNFPQALSHVALVNTALYLSRYEGRREEAAQ
ncbi:Glucoamylase [Labilithrix luteola]|uniref:Trehalase n=1 Tax=Labilithrix luteola TaxID=1391654 RepID=A0A0K1Q4Z4_9BACT|nr:glycoside hydrolase family 15 protein [Labilithrix luteola]AKV00784.1 Glucoamylase [Labilithrix luteola]